MSAFRERARQGAESIECGDRYEFVCTYEALSAPLSEGAGQLHLIVVPCRSLRVVRGGEIDVTGRERRNSS